MSVTRPLDMLADIVSIQALSQDQQSVLNQLGPSDATRLVRYLYPEFKNNPLSAEYLARFAEKMRNSALSVSDWSGQIIAVYEWLAAYKKRARFNDVVEYISCALEGSSLQMGHDIQWYLDHYGFAKSEEVPAGM
jgi:hypothetical protein